MFQNVGTRACYNTWSINCKLSVIDKCADTKKMHVWDFLFIYDLRSGTFCDLPIISNLMEEIPATHDGQSIHSMR